MKNLSVEDLKFSAKKVLSRAEMRTVSGGGLHPCADQCSSDMDCMGGSCVPVPSCNGNPIKPYDFVCKA